MTATDLKMVLAMLVLIQKHSAEREENETADELNLVIQTLRDLQKE